MRNVPSLRRATILLSSCPGEGSMVVEWIWLVLVFRGSFFFQRPSTVVLIYYVIGRLWIKVRKGRQKLTIDIY